MPCHLCNLWTPENGCTHYGPTCKKLIKTKVPKKITDEQLRSALAAFFSNNGKQTFHEFFTSWVQANIHPDLRYEAVLFDKQHIFIGEVLNIFNLIAETK